MEEMNSIITSYNKEKQEIIYHTNNENNYKIVQEICRLYIDRSSMTKEIERLNNIINETKEEINQYKKLIETSVKRNCKKIYKQEVLNILEMILLKLKGRDKE